LTRLIAGARVVRQGERDRPPRLHIAVGISEAIQPRAGMQTGQDPRGGQEDPEAPILELADVGAVGHRNTVCPAATERITARKG
jgi:electron transfer flavoprotein alpha subunit